MNQDNHLAVARLGLECLSEHGGVRLPPEWPSWLACAMYWDDTVAAVREREPEAWAQLVPIPGDGVVGMLATANLEPYELLLKCLVSACTALDAGDWARGFKILIAYSHYFGDLAEPVHAVSTATIDRLFARPPEYEFANLHSLLEDLAAPAAELRPPEFVPPPDLPVEDAALELAQIARQMEKRAARLLPPLVQAVYRLNQTSALAIKAEAVQLAAAAFGRLLSAALAAAGAIPMARTEGSSTEAVIELKHWLPDECILDMCANYRPGVDRTVIYGERERTQAPLVLGDRTCGGLGLIPLTPRASEHPDSAAIPFAHGQCLGLLGYQLNPRRRYRFRSRAGHNEAAARGGRICVALFTERELLIRSPALLPGSAPVEMDCEFSGERLYLYVEDLDAAFPPLKYAVFADPRLWLL